MLQKELKNTKVLRYVGIAVLIFVAILSRRIGSRAEEGVRFFTGLLRTVIYCGLFYAWGLSIRRRIVQKRIFRLLEGIVALMLFWMWMRTLRFFVLLDYTALRYAWYAYYIAILFIPVLSLLVALCIGKPATYRMPRLTAALLGISAALVLLVLTNDLHQWVFTFPEGKPYSDLDYGYNPGFWVVNAWVALVAAVTLGTILKKCRNPYAKKLRWQPFVPLGLLCAYAALYVLGVPFLREWLGDATVLECCMVVATWESCLQCGLIQCNTGYDKLFRASTMMAQITDADLRVRYASDHVLPVGRDVLQAALKKPVLVQNQVRLSSAPVAGGYIFWQEDIAPLLETQRVLGEVKEELKSYGNFIQEENRKKSRQKQLEAKKKLYAEVRHTTAPGAELLYRKAAALHRTTELAAARRLLAQIVAVGAYVKRRSNLVVLADNAQNVPSQELSLCLRESAANLQMLGVTCAYNLAFEGDMNVHAAAALFDFYEKMVEASLDTLTALSANFVHDNAHYSISLMVSGPTPATLQAALAHGTVESDEDGTVYATLCVLEGGAVL